MAEIAGGLGVQQVLDIISANSNASFVGGTATTPTTVANLITNFPPYATYMGQYARVSDLYGSVDDIMRCRFDGVAYRWIPQRPSFSGVAANTGGTVPIVPLVTPPTLRLTGTLLGSMSVVPSSVNAYVGQQQRVIMEGTLGLFTASITGLVGSNLSLLGGGSKLIEYSANGWFAAG
jgi:hypothetical protein